MTGIVIVGSINADLVMRCDRAPEAGETLHGHSDGFESGIGGKGLNQAYATASLSSSDMPVHMVGCVGDDGYGENALKVMQQVGLDIKHVTVKRGQATGVALIVVEETTGNNRILLSTGANACLLPEAFETTPEIFAGASIALFQLESPLETVRYALQKADQAGVKCLLNPAPAVSLTRDVLKHVSYLVPNETEAGILSGSKVETIEEAKYVSQQLLGTGIKEAVIITMGSQGCVVAIKAGEVTHIPAETVKAVDTTAAGDTFIGALTARLSEGIELHDAVKFATKASAITVTRKGACKSIPSRKEVFEACARPN